MLSHSNVYTFQPIDRHASDKAIQAVAATGGVICNNFYGSFLNSRGDASPFSIAKQAEYVKNLVGAEHTCVGADTVWNYADVMVWVLKDPKTFPPELGYGRATQMGKPGEIWGSARVLEEVYGWTDEEIAGYLGENLVRFYDVVWK